MTAVRWLAFLVFSCHEVPVVYGLCVEPYLVQSIKEYVAEEAWAKDECFDLSMDDQDPDDACKPVSQPQLIDHDNELDRNRCVNLV